VAGCLNFAGNTSFRDGHSRPGAFTDNALPVQTKDKPLDTADKHVTMLDVPPLRAGSYFHGPKIKYAA